MKIRLLSDLHNEGTEMKYSSIGEDLVILAGDIHTLTRGPRWARECWPNTEIIMIFGNHEFYRSSLDGEKLHMKAACAKNGIHLLDRNSVMLGEINFVGATLWTDFDKEDPTIMDDFHRYMNDAALINFSAEIAYRKISARDILREHVADRDYLDKELTKTTGRKIVITHHMPSAVCVHPMYKNHGDSNHYFYVDLNWMMTKHEPEIWIHGHTHTSVDVMYEKTRILCNPKGYTSRNGVAENPGFNSNLIIEV